MTLGHAAQSGQHPHLERGLDLYSTPPCATEALLRVEQLPHWIWEPAAGRGAIVNVLCDRGHAVVASDIADYGFPLHFVTDFLTTAKAPAGTECILTNPPFQIITEFVAHALDLCPCVIVLARLAFLEAESRSEILERRGLARVHVFRNRLPMMHRDGWTGPRASSAVAYAWFVWDRNHHGPPIINRISAKGATHEASNPVVRAAPQARSQTGRVRAPGDGIAPGRCAPAESRAPAETTGTVADPGASANVIMDSTSRMEERNAQKGTCDAVMINKTPATQRLATNWRDGQVLKRGIKIMKKTKLEAVGGSDNVTAPTSEPAVAPITKPGKFSLNKFKTSVPQP
jgi:hypothetical protein